MGFWIFMFCCTLLIPIIMIIAGNSMRLGKFKTINYIVGYRTRSTTEMSSYNANYLGGDILTGAKDIRQLVFGPRVTLRPYALGTPGRYLCSAATPPGPGAHGMCGANAADVALAALRARR